MQKIGFTTRIGWLLFMGTLCLLYACSPATGSQTSNDKKTVEADMNLAQEMTSDSLTMPTIDARAPAAVNTASFGLG